MISAPILWISYSCLVAGGTAAAALNIWNPGTGLLIAAWVAGLILSMIPVIRGFLVMAVLLVFLPWYSAIPLSLFINLVYAWWRTRLGYIDKVLTLGMTPTFDTPKDPNRILHSLWFVVFVVIGAISAESHTMTGNIWALSSSIASIVLIIISPFCWQKRKPVI